jgi:hypothetical protein
VFLVFDAWLGLAAGMIAASLTTVVILVLRRRGGAGIGILLPISLGFVVVKAIVGVVTESPVVYFGAGIALSALVAIAVGATAFTKRPAASYAIPLVTPYRHLSPDHPVYRRVSAQATAVVALAELGVTAWEAWHLTISTTSEFVVTRTLMAWPVMPTRAPIEARPIAAALPIPAVPPVIRTVLPVIDGFMAPPCQAAAAASRPTVRRGNQFRRGSL